MARCDQELCPMWDGHGCPCATYGLDREALPADGVFSVTVPEAMAVASCAVPGCDWTQAAGTEADAEQLLEQHRSARAAAERRALIDVPAPVRCEHCLGDGCGYCAGTGHASYLAEALDG